MNEVATDGRIAGAWVYEQPEIRYQWSVAGINDRISMLNRKTSRIIWIVISVIGVIAMVAFTVLPVLYTI